MQTRSWSKKAKKNIFRQIKVIISIILLFILQQSHEAIKTHFMEILNYHRKKTQKLNFVFLREKFYNEKSKSL